jgi:hypothetical protein
LLWAFSKRISAEQCISFEDVNSAGLKVAEQVIDRIAALKPRGLAFAIEAVANLHQVPEDWFKKVEKETLRKV